MKKFKKEVAKPISLAGCLEVFERAGIPESEYSQWNIGKIFKEAEKISVSKSITCKEVFINPM